MSDRRVALSLLAAFLMHASGAAWAQGQLFVTSSNTDGVAVFSRVASGNTAPLRLIAGANADMHDPVGVAVDGVHNELVVACAGVFAIPGSASIKTFALGADGDVSALRTIAGPASGLDEYSASPIGIAVDPVAGEIWVARNDGVIAVYARTANGDVAPIRTIAGAATELSGGQGLVLDDVNHEVWVTQSFSLLAFARTASGNTPPLRKITGTLPDLQIVAGITLDTVHDEIAVTTFNDSSLKVFARTANGNVAPLRTVAGPASGLLSPIGVASDPVSGQLVVTNPNNNSALTFYSRTANGNVAPQRTLAGSNTTLSGAYLLTITATSYPLTSFDYVQKSYVAYYGRPADPAGQDYWKSRMDAEGGTLAAIIQAFGNSEEFNRRYGGLDYPTLITKIYQQTLGRDPDPAGLAYYVGELAAGRRTLQTITLDVANGATTAPDSIVVANRMEAAAYYSDAVKNGCAYGTEQAGVNALAAVTADPGTLNAMKATIATRCGI